MTSFTKRNAKEMPGVSTTLTVVERDRRSFVAKEEEREDTYFSVFHPARWVIYRRPIFLPPHADAIALWRCHHGLGRRRRGRRRPRQSRSRRRRRRRSSVAAAERFRLCLSSLSLARSLCGRPFDWPFVFILSAAHWTPTTAAERHHHRRSRLSHRERPLLLPLPSQRHHLRFF